MHVCACVSWSAPLDAMKSQNLQTYFKATILLSPCPSSYLVSITQAVARRVHGRVPGSRECPVAAHPRRRLHWNCSTCAYLVSATWPGQPEGALILKVAEDQGSGLPELVPPPGRRRPGLPHIVSRGCHGGSAFPSSQKRGAGWPTGRSGPRSSAGWHVPASRDCWSLFSLPAVCSSSVS